ncbi:hypothetical protein ACWOOC_20900 [Citrobacter sp. ESY80]
MAGKALRAEAGIYFIFPAPERVPVALLWSWVSNGRSEAATACRGAEGVVCGGGKAATTGGCG